MRTLSRVVLKSLVFAVSDLRLMRIVHFYPPPLRVPPP